MSDLTPRFNWTIDEITEIYALPLDTLIARALQVKQGHWPDGKIQKSQLLSIKTGGCPEDCGYCSQSAHFDTGVTADKLMPLEAVVAAARRAKAQGADRFCMGAAWRELKDRDVPKVSAMISAVKAEGLETCVTLGMLTEQQAKDLKSAGLDYYNHNLDTSPEYYPSVVSTRSYEDRLQTLAHLRTADINVCCGGIIGMGESREDRISLLQQLATLSPHPESVPLNMLVPIAGTALGTSQPVSVVEMARMIAVCRILFPKSWVRIAAGRDGMSTEGQTLLLVAGANSIFIGDRLLTTDNPADDQDRLWLDEAGFKDGLERDVDTGHDAKAL